MEVCEVEVSMAGAASRYAFPSPYTDLYVIGAFVGWGREYVEGVVAGE